MSALSLALFRRASAYDIAAGAARLRASSAWLAFKSAARHLQLSNIAGGLVEFRWDRLYQSARFCSVSLVLILRPRYWRQYRLFIIIIGRLK